MRRKLVFIPLFLALLASLIPNAYAGEMRKEFSTTCHVLGTAEVNVEIDFYLYDFSYHKFWFNISNLDTSPIEWHSFKIENYTLYMWVRGNQNQYKPIYYLYGLTHTWLRLGVSYRCTGKVFWSLNIIETDVPVCTSYDWYWDNKDEIESWGVKTEMETGAIYLAPKVRGKIKFEFYPESGEFALSKIKVYSVQWAFHFPSTTHLYDEFNDDIFTEWDYADLSDINYTIIHYESDSIIKFYDFIEPTNPEEKKEVSFWEKWKANAWEALKKGWHHIASGLGSVLPKEFRDFFKWLWDTLNWLWALMTLIFAFVFQLMPYLGLIIFITFLGAVADCVIQGDWEPLLNLIRWLYSIASSVVTGIATVIHTIWDFIKWW